MRDVVPLIIVKIGTGTVPVIDAVRRAMNRQGQAAAKATLISYGRPGSLELKRNTASIA